jgi:hypothetical protein
MTWWVVALLVALALVGIGIVFPRLAKAYSRGVAMDRCAELEAQLNAMGPGTPAEQRTSIEAQLRACQETIPDADLGELGVRRCALLEQGIVQEWANYKTVSYTDFSQREAKRGAILRGEADLVRCYRQTRDDDDVSPQAADLHHPQPRGERSSRALLGRPRAGLRPHQRRVGARGHGEGASRVVDVPRPAAAALARGRREDRPARGGRGRCARRRRPARSSAPRAAAGADDTVRTVEPA